MNNRLCFLSARALADGYRTGECSPVDAVEAYLARIETLNPYYRAYMTVSGAAALDSARESGRRYANGTARSLEGLPVSLKDLIGVAGQICTAGSATRLRTVAQRTASVVEQLARLGAVVLGKVHTMEFAFGSWGGNQHLGTPRNPWSNVALMTPGGSSSGSAVAVASFLSPWSIGTDTGGSIRVPASFNGVVGLKSTLGRISRYGVVPMCPSLDSVGVIARNVYDAAWLSEQLQHSDPRDAATEGAGTANMLSATHLGAAGMRVGRVDVTGWLREGLITSDVALAYDSAVDTVKRLGAQIIEMKLPVDVTKAGKDSPIMAYEAYREHGGIAGQSDAVMDDAVRRRILAGASITPAAYEEAMALRRHESILFHEALGEVDTLMVPTTPCAAIPLSAVDEARTASVLTRFVNQLGLCSIALPCGFTQLPGSTPVAAKHDGAPTEVSPENLRARFEPMPLSVQFVSRAYDEASIVRAASALETALALKMTPPLLYSR